jgi:hypothetical protein
MRPPVEMSARVRALHGRLTRLLMDQGLTPRGVRGGISYKLGRRTLCRIDPKSEFLRVYVGAVAELSAPPELRGPYRQRGWLIVRPRDGGVAEQYLAAVMAKFIEGAG